MKPRAKKRLKILASFLLLSVTLFLFAGYAFGDDEEDGGTFTYTKPTEVTFAHDVHMDAGLECDSCHDGLFEMEIGAAEASGDFTMKSLYEGKYCGACHDGDMAFAANADCTNCHAAGKRIIFTEPVKAVIFEHGFHIEQGMGCDSCHGEIFQMKKGVAEAGDDFTMQSLYDGKYCGACHDGDSAFASNTRCTACHIGVKGHDRLIGKDKKSESGHGSGH